MLTVNNKKILVVGAGLAGATIARVLAENSFIVQIIDKRSHVAGNAYDYLNVFNERIHKYGPHLLHCNKDSKALSFLSRFTEWINYEHKVRALLKDGRTTPLPVNQITIEDVYGVHFRNEKEVKLFLDEIRDINLIPKNSDELFQSTVGNKLADIFFRPYTKKMWGVEPNSLSIGIGSRLPVRVNKDCRYFEDSFQALPKNGYTKMVEKMLDHENINIELNKNFKKGMEKEFMHSFLCIPIDKYYDYRYGHLPYRSIKFENKVLKDTPNLECPVINFTDSSKYTRMTQWDLLPNNPKKRCKEKTVTYEIPCSIEINPGEYYYPIHTSSSREIFSKYKNISRKNSNVTFCGRTGLFRYIDMIPAVLLHLEISRKFLFNFEE